MRLWKLTDDEFIARVRRFHRTRRIWGTLLLIVGLIFVVVLLVSGQHLSHQSLELLNLITEAEHPTREQMAQAADNVSFSVGFMLGSTFGALRIFSALFVGIGFGILINPDRKSRMLLEYWDQRNPAP
ncbi:MAG: hypothetical protein V3U29_03250 [Phycisphaeraceae bacterium]